MQTQRTRRNKIAAPRDFRSLLQEELLRRCRENPQYSLRSFAKALRIEPSALSQIINAKRPITEKMKLRLGNALGLSTDEIGHFTATDALSSYQQLELDAFAIVSDWYYYAILELTYVDGFQSSADWISKRLGITKSEANIAIERLTRLGLLEETKDGRWIDKSANGRLSHLNPALTSNASKNYQMQLLDLSKRAVQEVELEKRNHTSVTICFDPDDLPRAIEQISKFRRKFAKDFQPKNKAKEVYQIQISFFPLTKQSKERIFP